MSVSLENVLVIDGDRERVDRVRSAAKVAGAFSSVTAVTTAAQGLEHLNKSEYQLILIAVDILEGDLREFVAKVQASSGGQIASRVGLTGKNIEQHMLATLMLKGLDSVLTEPFSADLFHEVIELAVRLVSERTVERNKRLVEIALVDAVTYVDAAAQRLKKNKPARSSSRVRDKLHDTLQDCHAIDEELYFTVLVDKLVSLSAKKRRRQVYSGASERLRKKLEKEYAETLLEED